MDLTKIVQGVNTKLAGELLTYDMMKGYLDDTIDEINVNLDSKFPVFSEFTSAAYPDNYPDYNFFPDKYIRQVVIMGAAYKFYVTDEEGIDTAKNYGYSYSDAMFTMIRDYLSQVPLAYQANNDGSMLMSETGMAETPFDFSLLNAPDNSF